MEKAKKKINKKSEIKGLYRTSYPSAENIGDSKSLSSASGTVEDADGVESNDSVQVNQEFKLDKDRKLIDLYSKWKKLGKHSKTRKYARKAVLDYVTGLISDEKTTEQAVKAYLSDMHISDKELRNWNNFINKFVLD